MCSTFPRFGPSPDMSVVAIWSLEASSMTFNIREYTFATGCLQREISTTMTGPGAAVRSAAAGLEGLHVFSRSENSRYNAFDSVHALTLSPTLS